MVGAKLASDTRSRCFDRGGLSEDCISAQLQEDCFLVDRKRAVQCGLSL